MYFFSKLYESISVFVKHIGTAWQLAHGVWKISALQKPIVSIFGGHLATGSDQEKQAYDIAAALVKNNISVITGGGSGIMQAANFGAYQADPAHVRTMGITIRNFVEDTNVYAQKSAITVNYLAVRKWFLIDHSVGFVIFPGGIGTLNEFTELLVLTEARHQTKMPIVLMGTVFWKPFLHWFYETQRLGLIGHEVSSYFMVTDDCDAAINYLVESCIKCMPGAHAGCSQKSTSDKK